MSYIGNSPGVASQRVESAFTATASQTVFTPTSGYTLGYCDVYLNGIKLVNGDDYTASNGTSITLATAASEGDSIVIVASFPRGLSDGYLKAEADARYLKVDGSNYVTGNLGVGTSSVLGNSTLNATLGVVARNSSSTQGWFQTYNANAGADLKTWRFGGDNSGNLLFQTVNDAYSASTGRITFDPAGRLLVGSTTATQTNNLLEVRKDQSTTTSLNVVNNSSSASYVDANLTLTGYNTGLLLGSVGGNVTTYGISNIAGVAPAGVGYMMMFSSYPMAISHYANQPIVFGTSNTERARINSSGLTLNSDLAFRDSGGGGTYMKVRVEKFGITATSGGAVVNLSSGSRFVGLVIIAGDSNDSASGVWHVVSDSEYDFEAITALNTKGGAAYTGPATLSLGSSLGGSLKLTVTGSGYRVYQVMMIGNFG